MGLHSSEGAPGAVGMGVRRHLVKATLGVHLYLEGKRSKEHS